MNVIVLDLSDSHDDARLAGKLAAVTGGEVSVCRMTRSLGADGPPAWTLHFGTGEQVRTMGEPDGLLCAALLTCDQFADDAPLVVLTADPADWATHFRRLSEADGKTLDVFLSFDTDGPSKLCVQPDTAALLRLTNGLTPGLAWYRTTKLFFDSAKQVIRKDARWNGQYTSDSLYRELALHDARVAYHGRPWDAGPAA